MVIICITIIILALVVGAVILGWKYLSRDYAIEATQDTQLDDISVLVSNINQRWFDYDNAPDNEKHNYKPSDMEIRDILETIYTISTSGYEPDNKQ